MHSTCLTHRQEVLLGFKRETAPGEYGRPRQVLPLPSGFNMTPHCFSLFICQFLILLFSLCAIPIYTLSWLLHSVTKQCSLVPSCNRLPLFIPCLSSTSLLYVKKKKLAFQTFPEFQRVNLIRVVRECRKENSQVRQNNNSLATKQSQGLLVPLQGLQIIS